MDRNGISLVDMFLKGGNQKSESSKYCVKFKILVSDYVSYPLV
jgi:hypothetical protein